MRFIPLIASILYTSTRGVSGSSSSSSSSSATAGRDVEESRKSGLGEIGFNKKGLLRISTTSGELDDEVDNQLRLTSYSPKTDIESPIVEDGTGLEKNLDSDDDYVEGEEDEPADDEEDEDHVVVSKFHAVAEKPLLLEGIVKSEIERARDNSPTEFHALTEWLDIADRKRDPDLGPRRAPLIPNMKSPNTEILSVNKRLNGKPQQNILLIGKAIANSITSAVFHIATLPNHAIKYQVRCPIPKGEEDVAEESYDDMIASIHDMVKEYFFLKRLERLGISPKVQVLSGPTILKDDMLLYTPTEDGIRKRVSGSVSPKLNLSFSDYPPIDVNGSICKNGEIRFMIMDKVGQSIGSMLEKQYRGNPVPMNRALRIGASMIRKLEILHKVGMLHRDIHMGNFAFPLGADDGVDVLLIDYGLSGYANSVTSEEVVDPWFDQFEMRGIGAFNAQRSTWEMRGYQSSYRDDFMRTMQLVGMMIHGYTRYVGEMNHIAAQSAAMADMAGAFGQPKVSTVFPIMRKKMLEILHAGVTRPVDMVPAAYGEDARQIIEELTLDVQQVGNQLNNSVYALPDYGHFIRSLEKAAAAMEGCSDL